ELRKAKVPYVILGSQSFFDRKEVKDILAYLRAIDSPRDEVSLLRIINNPPRGIGERTVEGLLKATVTAGQPIWRGLRGARVPPAIPATAREAVGRFAQLVQRYHDELQNPHPGPLPKGEGGKRSLVDLVRRLITEIGYQAELRRIYPDPNELESRWGAVEE